MYPCCTAYLEGLVLAALIVALATFRRLNENPIEYVMNVVTLAIGWPLTLIIAIMVVAERILESLKGGNADDQRR